jgi:hypothetical protein
MLASVASSTQLWLTVLQSTSESIKQGLTSMLAWEDLMPRGQVRPSSPLLPPLLPPALSAGAVATAAAAALHDDAAAAATSTPAMMQALLQAINSVYDSTLPPRELSDSPNVFMGRSGVKAVGGWWTNAGKLSSPSSVVVAATVNRLVRASCWTYT